MLLGFPERHHHWAGAMGPHLRGIAAQIDTNRRERMLRQHDVGECSTQILDVFLYAALNPSRHTIVNDGIRRKQTSVYVPFTIVHCVAVPRQNFLDLNAV